MHSTPVAWQYVDRSGTTYPLDYSGWRGEDSSPLWIEPGAGITPEQIDRKLRSIWRYHQALPIDLDHAVTLGEGFTPLLPLDLGETELLIKPEWFNPTSSFKDRGVSVLVSHLKQQGAQCILEDSSGNGGAAVAAYAAAAGIDATIVVPAATSAEKLLLARACGATVLPVEGTRDEVAAEAMRLAADIPYASHNWQPMFLQGIKTIGYEVWEQLGYRAPDNIVAVAGSGSLVMGCDLAFRELANSGQVDRLPRLFVGQPDNWAGIVDKLHGVDPESRLPRLPSLAEGASIASPVRADEAVAAIRRSGGAGYAVPEMDIAAATRSLARRGLFAEPTSAVALAACQHFLATGQITADQTTVVVLTGTALKSTQAMQLILQG